MLEERLLNRRTVLGMIQMSPATLNRALRDGAFPAPYRIGRRLRVWKLSELVTFMEAAKKDPREIPQAALLAKAERSKRKTDQLQKAAGPGREPGPA